MNKPLLYTKDSRKRGRKAVEAIFSVRLPIKNGSFRCPCKGTIPSGIGMDKPFVSKI